MAVVLLAASASAEVTFEYIGENIWGTSLSSDGSAVAGNTEGVYETFRWTEETGVELLGRATSPYIGTGAGTPDISADGTRISATIITEDLLYATQGRWTLGEGWQVTMPPLPPDGGSLDSSYGSAWGLSGDGETVTGFYWSPGHPQGIARPSAWNEIDGIVDVGTEFRSGRVNHANYDGTVLVGWDEATFGYWRPTVWMNGERSTLSIYEAFTDASCVNDAGTVIGGYGYEDATMRFPAAVWRWDGATWIEELLGQLPGTVPYNGLTNVEDMTLDGGIMVGYNRFVNPNLATGFIWTEETGLIDVEDFLIDNGVVLEEDFNILTLSGISDNGRVLMGSGLINVAPFTAKTFLIHTDVFTAVPEWADESQGLNLRVSKNPFRSNTTLSFSLPATADLRMDIYDVQGRLVRNLHAGSAAAGDRQLLWDGLDSQGRPVRSGVYFAKASAGNRVDTQKLMVLR
ncbi:T9SS type A sorting domain-containing protein [bacterium]|nr:T9SS type A sorting domain-containing protein [bacterium]